MNQAKSNYQILKKEVIDQGLCTHCGLCAGMSKKTIEMKNTDYGPLPESVNNKKALLTSTVLESCPGRIINYPRLNKFLFNKLPKNFLLGEYKNIFIAYSKDAKIRRSGASAGVITHLCLELLNEKKVDGVIASRLKKMPPWETETIIATTKEEILSCSQSIYQPIPVLEILDKLKEFNGNVALVGLPDQVAAIRNLQLAKSPIVKKIKYCIGPYVGTNMYFSSIKSFLKSNGIKDYRQIKNLKYRDGEWPGHLSILLKNGKKFKAKKFYYNYLIPFFITKSSLTSVDLTNELTDISVGDAWNPKYEKQRQGFSVVIARSNKGSQLLRSMQKKGLLELSKITEKEAVGMHGHMLEFKKRGAFIRLKIRKISGKKIPNYGYKNTTIPLKRILIELVIVVVFKICSFKIVRKTMELIPVDLMGKVFDKTRVAWKSITRETKRKNLLDFSFKIEKYDN